MVMFEKTDLGLKWRKKTFLSQIVGTRELLLNIQNFLIKYLKLDRAKLTQNIKNHNHFALRYRGNTKALKIFDWLYSGVENYLDRKYFAYLTIRKELTE